MKAAYLILCLALIWSAAGCTRRYAITTTNGHKVYTTSKPKLQKGVYTYKDPAGREAYVPAGRVREIAPAKASKERSNTFVPTVGR